MRIATIFLLLSCKAIQKKSLRTSNWQAEYFVYCHKNIHIVLFLYLFLFLLFLHNSCFIFNVYTHFIVVVRCFFGGLAKIWFMERDLFFCLCFIVSISAICVSFIHNLTIVFVYAQIEYQPNRRAQKQRHAEDCLGKIKSIVYEFDFFSHFYSLLFVNK